jgi:hypothetical protein
LRISVQISELFAVRRGLGVLQRTLRPGPIR